MRAARQRRHLAACYLIASILVVLPAAVAAQQAVVAVYGDPIGGTSCNLFDQSAGPKTVYVLLTSIPVQSIQFSVPLPECLNGVYLQDVIPFPSVGGGGSLVGNSQTGITMSFNECVSGFQQHILTIEYFSFGTAGDCCLWQPQPHADTGQLDAVDCDGILRPASGFYQYVNSNTCCGHAYPVTAPYDPVPAMGATNVPTNAELAWEGAYLPLVVVRLGTQNGSRPPLVYEGPLLSTFDPGDLDPNTTYYWEVEQHEGDCYNCNSEAVSERWTFTTGSGPVGTETSTWSQIKGLYQ